MAEGKPSKADKKAAKSDAKAEKSVKALRSEVHDRLADLETHLYKCEDRYLNRTSVYGNIFRGFEGFVDARIRSLNHPRKDHMIMPSERALSASSATSKVTSEDLRREAEHSMSHLAAANGNYAPLRRHPSFETQPLTPLQNPQPLTSGLSQRPSRKRQRDSSDEDEAYIPEGDL